MLRARLVRLTGLAGSVLLAVAAWLGGVQPTWRPSPHLYALLRGDRGFLLPASWIIGTALLIGAWWVGRTVVPSVRWAYVTAALWAAPLLLPLPLGSRDVYSYACQGYVFAAGHDPYDAGVDVLGCPWLETVSPIWRDSPAPYGPLFVVLAGAAVKLGGSLVGTIAVLRLVAIAGVVLAAACLPALARRAGVAEHRAAWLVLASPLVAVHLVSGAHNDAVMVGLLLAGFAVVSAWPGRTAALLAGGALLGLAVAVKATAVVAVPFAALVAIDGPFRLRGLLRDGGAVVAGMVGSLAAVSAASGLGLGWVNGLARSGETIQWTSPPTAVGMTISYLGRPFGVDLPAVAVVRALAVVVLAVLLVVVWWRARHGNALFLAGVALAATVVFAPVFHPWYAMWPLALLAASAERTRWFVVPCAAVGALTLPDGASLSSYTKFPGALAMTALVIYGIVRAVRHWRSRRPAHAIDAHAI